MPNGVPVKRLFQGLTVPTQMLEDLLYRARLHLAAGRMREARTIASFLVQELEPKSPEAHVILSKVAFATGQPALALTEAARAAVLDPQNTKVREQLEASLGRLAMDPKVEPLLAMGARELLDRMHQTPANKMPSTSGTTRATSVDLVVPMRAPHGSEMNVVETAKRLRRHVKTTIWSDPPPHKALLEIDPTIKAITRDSFPSGDVLAIIGMFQQAGPWVAQARPQRIILDLNTFHVPGLLRWLGVAKRLPVDRIDLMFASHWLRKGVGADGTVRPSPIDLARFSVRSPVRAVTSIGRMSRDHLSKHHPQNVSVYAKLLEMGIDISILGAGEIRPFLFEHSRLTLMPAHAMPPERFLHSIDLFFYRTGTAFESWGRVVTEAMACGLPIVCHKAGGYAEIVRDNENGFLFETSDEAVQIIATLRSDAATLARIGEAARETVVDLFSPKSDDQLVEFYTRI